MRRDVGAMFHIAQGSRPPRVHFTFKFRCERCQQTFRSFVSLQSLLDDDFECGGVACGQQMSIRQHHLPGTLFMMNQCETFAFAEQLARDVIAAFPWAGENVVTSQNPCH